MEFQYRHEWKHVLNTADMLVLRQRLSAVMQRDPHAKDGKYYIRSLYFDNINDKALREKIDGVTVHTVNGGDLIACFDPNIPESAIRTIAKRQPLRAVFRDSSFASAPQKINVEEIFKLLSPTTTIKVI